MDKTRTNIFDIKFLFGLFIVLVGLSMLLRNLGILPYINFWDFWPVILILIGIGHLNRPAAERSVISGTILIALGSIFIAKNLDLFYFQLTDVWPFILILFGIYILKISIWGRHQSSYQSETINLSFILGGGDFKYTSSNIDGGNVIAIMGGGKIDLRQADMEKETIVIDAFAFIGGIEFRAPKDWHVIIKGFPFMGGMDNSTNPIEESQNGIPSKKKFLIIKGAAIMGGIEVKN